MTLLSSRNSLIHSDFLKDLTWPQKKYTIQFFYGEADFIRHACQPAFATCGVFSDFTRHAWLLSMACWGPDTPHFVRQACHRLLTGEGVCSGVSDRPAKLPAYVCWHASGILILQHHWKMSKKHRTHWQNF